MPLWEDCDGKLIVDATGKPAECDTDPCEPVIGTKIITCGGTVNYVVPDVDAGSYEVTLSGFGGALSVINGTYVVPAGANWGTGTAFFPSAGTGFGMRITVNFRSSGCNRRVEIRVYCNVGQTSFGAMIYQVTDAGSVTIDMTAGTTVPLSSAFNGPCHSSGTWPFTVGLRAFV